MIIRHDLKLVFIHIPKCGGKSIRRIFKIGCKDQNDIIDLWNYEYNFTLSRYIDRAHMTLSDLKTREEFGYLKGYRVIACIRNPYMRLKSAANEYYRQKCKKSEQDVAKKKITNYMRVNYYKEIENKHNYMDPRFIHSMPIYRFTHLGTEAMVDYFIHCENLREEFGKVGQALDLPNKIKEEANRTLVNEEINQNETKLTENEIRIANRIYKQDFEIFKEYDKLPSGKDKRLIADAGEVKNIHEADKVTWHWGPTAEKKIINVNRRREKLKNIVIE